MSDCEDSEEIRARGDRTESDRDGRIRSHGPCQLPLDPFSLPLAGLNRRSFADRAFIGDHQGSLRPGPDGHRDERRTWRVRDELHGRYSRRRRSVRERCLLSSDVSSKQRVNSYLSMIRMPITPCLPSRPEPTSVDTAELSKVDPSVSVCCDVHNTLVNSTLRLFGNDYVKDKYLPGLATNVVSRQAE
jgi:hypothetical protein